ncbi:unnamed protein product [Euphydryas editha]|uniref:DDE-1 domain-containing protein n=1 Tax=Euphydryas editha TaxID=104508 RepID=A0AAU9UV57_EUPED|nr:unnamed protein product [Euphydryas editha]
MNTRNICKLFEIYIRYGSCFSYDDWFKHFLKAKPTADDPALLILNRYNTHTKNLDFIDLARQNHTTVLCLPPHCSHRLQPLDVSFMGPVNKYYIRPVEKYYRNNPGRAITVFQFSKLFGEAYSEAAQQSIAVSGFRKCGIEPLDRHVFKDHDFLPADTTDVTLVEPKAQQNEYNKENVTPEREESPSLLDTVEEKLVATPPMFDLQEEKTLEETPAVTPPILDPLVNTVLQEIPVTASPMLSQHTPITIANFESTTEHIMGNNT